MKKGILLSMLSLALLFSAFTVYDRAPYSIDVANSSVKWVGYHLVKSYEHNGTVSIKSGSLDTENGKITGGTVVIDMTTISNNDLEGKKNAKLVEHLKSDDFFGVDKNPEAKLVIKKVNGNTATGDITIKGITEEISFEISDSKVTDSSITASVTLKIDRTKHKVMYGWTIENAMLSNEFQLDVKITANK